MGSGTDFVFRPAQTPGVPIAGLEKLFPVHRVYCVALNYRKHVREMGGSLREPPFFFSKPADAVCTDPAIRFPPMTAKLQHEVELVVALGRGGVNIPLEQAPSLVFGYAVGVDLTRRDLQTEAKKLGRPWTTAKGFDHSAPVSAIRPVSECGHPDNALISLSVNGKSRQQGNINEMTWSVPEVIAELSRYFELKAGDLIFTGTPSGVGDLLPGDRVECTIGDVGSLAFLMEAS
jgi:fumarylpyruvate hydrolase